MSLLDRDQITRTLTHYAYSVDDRDFGALREIFTPDAHLDYTASGGPESGDLDEVLNWIEAGLGAMGPSQHMLTNFQIEIDEDDGTATSRCYMFNPLLFPGDGDDPVPVMVLGGEYRDRWMRIDDDWKIIGRVHMVTWTKTLPA